MSAWKAALLILMKIILFVVIGTVLIRYLDVHWVHIPFNKGTWLVGLMAIWTGLSFPEWIFQTWIKYRDG